MLTRAFGDRNRMLVTDIDQHTSDANPRAAVDYVDGWTTTLHAAGFLSMIYGSFELAADLATRATVPPDGVWVPRYRTHEPEPSRDPHKIPGVPDHAFAQLGQRAWQYAAAFANPGTTKVTPCRIAGIDVDVSTVDEAVFVAAPGAVAAAVVGPRPAGEVHTSAGGADRHVVVPGDTLSALERTFSCARGPCSPSTRS